MKEDDRSGQIDVIQQFVGQGVSGIVVAPLDSKALLPPIQMASQQKIPVVIMDSALEGTVGQDFVSFVATDNHKGGELGGELKASVDFYSTSGFRDLTLNVSERCHTLAEISEFLADAGLRFRGFFPPHLFQLLRQRHPAATQPGASLAGGHPP